MADGRFAGFQRIISLINAMASGEAVGISVEREVGENCGNLKFIAAANLNPSDHSFLSGVPMTEQILNISSISELPGNKGRNVYSSAMIQPTAQMSMGAEYIVERSRTSGARYHRVET